MFTSFVFERINETTWAYLSSLLMIALFFKFNRFWSVRNLDLLLIILLAPGILMVHFGQTEYRALVDSTRSTSAPVVPGETATTPNPVETRPTPETGENRTRLDKPLDSSADNTAADNQSLDADLKSSLRSARGLQRLGYYWLFSAGLLLLIRLILDNSLIRRPLLESNLTIGGLVFLGCTLMIFLFLNVVNSRALPDDVRGVQSVSKWLQRKAAEKDDLDQLLQRGPGYTIFSLLPAISTSRGDVMSTDLDDETLNDLNKVETSEVRAADEQKRTQTIPKKIPSDPSNKNTADQDGPAADGNTVSESSKAEGRQEGDSKNDEKSKRDASRAINYYVAAAKILAITSQFAIVIGLILICYWHFNNFRMGIEAATIYLIIPYTAIYMGHVMHALPAALIVWAIATLKRPWVAGLLIGFAIGVSYYPLFLLVLWISFYWEKGKWPFIYGVLIGLGICTLGLIFTSVNVTQFLAQLQRMLGVFAPRMKNLGGIWQLGWDQWFRMPLLAAFIVFSASFAFWPIQKNIGSLISCTAAVMVALQFWHGFDGGTYLAYYIPLTLLVFLRPNVDGRDASFELSNS